MVVPTQIDFDYTLHFSIIKKRLKTLNIFNFVQKILEDICNSLIAHNCCFAFLISYKIVDSGYIATKILTVRRYRLMLDPN